MSRPPRDLDDRPAVLLVDDDPTVIDILSVWIEAAGYRTVPCANADDFLHALRVARPALAIVDLHLGGVNGLDLLPACQRIAPATPVVMLTRDSTAATIVEAMRRGARDYLLKPLDRAALVQAIHGLARPPRSTEPAIAPSLVGEGAEMRALRERIGAVARADVTLLLRGETGTGKELVAHAVHQASARSGGPFVAVSCAAIPETLQDSELFGHERGAFTGATARRIGRFEQAHGGTLFLDEVGELTPALQARMLRVLQERRFRRLGGTQEISADIRLISATHRNLRAEVAAGRFREDLYYRLSVFELELPPLRARTEDIPALAASLGEAFARRTGLPVPTFSPEATALLVAHTWPGNVRELQSAISHAMVLAADRPIAPDHLPPTVPPRGAPATARDALEDVERRLIEQALMAAGGNASAAMRALGMPRTTFYRRMKQHGFGTPS